VPARVLHETEVPAGAEGDTEVRTLIDRSSGSRELVQRVLRAGPAGRVRIGHSVAEEVLYVVEGSGEVAGRGAAGAVAGRGAGHHVLEPGTGVLVPPGSPVAVAAGPDGLALVSVLSPQPEDGAAGVGGGEPALRIVREADQEAEPAGDDRSFRVLIDPRVGCRSVTQFVGSIERSRAPLHTHTYEEAIYVIGGEGVLHADGLDVPVRRGSSVFLPPGTPHCLENAGA
jgi:quercetin dioxygenase-like cupin family protein